MKRLLLTLFSLLCLVCSPAQERTNLARHKVIKNPEIEYCPSWIEVHAIELTKEATILRGNLHHRPNYWCRVSDNAFLKDRNTDKQFKILRAEGIQLNEQVVMPKSGRVPLTLYFEPLDADVRELNFIEPNARPMSLVYGIRLHSQPKASKKAKVFDPTRLTSAYYLQQQYKPDTNWRFDNERYKLSDEVLFRSGKAVLTVHLAHVPKELSATMGAATLCVSNQITREEQNVTANYDAAGSSWTFHLDLPHPQWVSGFHIGNIFIQPGDTLDVYSSLVTNEFSEPLYTTFRSSSESAQINSLTNYFMKKYSKRDFDYGLVSKAVAAGKDSVLCFIERFMGQTVGLLENEALRQELIHTPLSTFGKDVVMMSVVAENMIKVKDILLLYKDGKYKITQRPDGTSVQEIDSTFQPLDYQEVFAPLIPYKNLIYDNPLALCEASQWVFVNRCVYSEFLRQYKMEQDAQGNWNYVRKDPFGLKGTFMSDIEMAQGFSSTLNSTVESITLQDNKEILKNTLDGMEVLTVTALKDINSFAVARGVLGYYRNFVRTTEGRAEGEDSKWTAEQRALWEKLFGKYRGNLLVIDFWGLGCGPCRSGMIHMRDKVEAMKDEPIKFIYIAATDGETQKAQSEEWMSQNQIRGEHLFITQSEWAMLGSMLTFSAIPRYVLCGPDGRLIQNDFSIYNYDVDGLKGLVKKFVPIQ